MGELTGRTRGARWRRQGSPTTHNKSFQGGENHTRPRLPGPKPRHSHPLRSFPSSRGLHLFLGLSFLTPLHLTACPSHPFKARTVQLFSANCQQVFVHVIESCSNNEMP